MDSACNNGERLINHWRRKKEDHISLYLEKLYSEIKHKMDNPPIKRGKNERGPSSYYHRINLYFNENNKQEKKLEAIKNWAEYQGLVFCVKVIGDNIHIQPRQLYYRIYLIWDMSGDQAERMILGDANIC